MSSDFISAFLSQRDRRYRSLTGPRTIDVYRDADGRWSEERAALHEKIIGNLLGTKTATDRPFFMAFAGGANAAKSVVMKAMMAEGVFDLQNTVIIKLDDFALLPEFSQLYWQYPHPEKASELVDEYYHIVEQTLVAARARGLNVVLDDHGDYPGHYARLVRRAKEDASTAPLDTLLAATILDPDYFLNGWCLNQQKRTKPVVKTDGIVTTICDELKPWTLWALESHKAMPFLLEDQLVPLFDRTALYEIGHKAPGSIPLLAMYGKCPDGLTDRSVVDEGLFTGLMDKWRNLNLDGKTWEDVWFDEGQPFKPLYGNPDAPPPHADYAAVADAQRSVWNKSGPSPLAKRPLPERLAHFHIKRGYMACAL